MGSLRRYDAVGAVFSWPKTAQPLQEARDRHVVSGAPGVCDSPYGRALSFDGAADYITLGAAHEDLLRFDSGTQDFSVVAWVRRAVTGVTGVVFDKRDGATDGYFLYVRDTDIPFFYVNAAGITGPAVADTEWHCLIAVVDRSASITMYTDGIPGGSTAIAGPAMATTTAPRIGAKSFDGASKFNGDIAGVLVFPRVLSAVECLDIATGRAF